MNPSLEEIVALETKVWEALKSGDANLDRKMLAENFLGVYPTGFATRQEHCDQLNSGPTVANYEITLPRLTILRENLVLLSYLASWSRLQNGSTQKPEQMYISSIWERSGERWENTFSQDTPVAN